MYMPEHSPVHGLNAVSGEIVVLQSVNIEVAFNSLLCETTMSQVYRNLEKKPIEAVYTFPLAGRAILLGLKVVIGGRELQGMVVEKASAEEQYEEAITAGDAAVMLEQVQPGLYTMNVGNVLAGQEVTITVLYAELYSWQDDTLRFRLPTTIAPRYGNPE
jgi:Ca-activated chloride channel homolog